MINGDVFAFLAAPDRDSSLFAVSKAILKIRETGKTFKEIGKALDIDESTVRAAKNEEHMLGFEQIAQLCYYWPEETRPIKQLWDRNQIDLTVEDRMRLIEQQLDAIRREAAA